VHEPTRLTRVDVALVDSIPCTTIERTLFDLAGVVGPRTIELAVDAALRRDLTSVARLIATRDRLARRGRRGAAGFRTVLEARDVTAAFPESPPERLVARSLVRHGLPAPKFQHEVVDDNGRFVARVDLAYPDYRIAIEYDSYQEHIGKAALDRDSARRNRLIAVGWTVLSATPADLRNDCTALVRALRVFASSDDAHSVSDPAATQFGGVARSRGRDAP
jgi:very-short-patch-repair endonuclease